jgi:hypothetical protein
MIAWAIILGIMLFHENAKINVLKQNHQKIDAFKKIQKSSFEGLKNYLMYKVHGFDILFVLPSTSVVANEASIPDDLSSKIDGFTKVQIYKNLKGKSLTSRGKGISLDISVIIKFLIALIAILSGFDAFKNEDYLKSLSSIWKHRKTFFYTIISRFLFFIMTFLLVMTILLIFIRIRGVKFNPGDSPFLAGLLLEAVVFLAIFFFMGVLFGLLRNKKTAILLTFLSWFFINIANYWFIKPAVEPEFPDVIKDYQAVLDKKKIFTEFENFAEKKYGKFDRKNMEKARKVIEYFWENYYLKKIAPLEKKLRDMIARSIEKDRSISKFFPGPFFDITANEVSGRGYTNYLRFYDYSIEMQTKFVRFNIDRDYYNDPKVMVNFIKGDEDIFYGKAALPPNFLSGILIQLGYLVILIIACYFCYLRKMFPRPKDAKAFDNLSFDLKSGENFTMQDCTDDDTLRPQLINVFLRKKRELPVIFTLDGKPFPVGEKPFIIFVPKPRDIPDELKGKHLVYLFKRVFNLPGQDITQLEKEIGKKTLEKHFCKMKKEEKYKLVLLLYFLVKAPIYVFDSFAEGISDRLSQEMFAIVEDKLPAGSMIIDLTVLERKWNNQQHWCAVHFKDGKYRLYKPK